MDWDASTTSTKIQHFLSIIFRGLLVVGCCQVFACKLQLNEWNVRMINVLA